MTNDEDALNELKAVSNTEKKHPIEHYLYFLKEESASKANSLLLENGYETECRLSALGDEWLVLVKTRVSPESDDIHKMRDMLEQIAEENDGEYDGWEAEVQN